MSEGELIAGVAEGVFVEVAGVEAGFRGVAADDFAGLAIERDGAVGGGVVVSEHIIVGVFDDAAAAAVVSHERDVGGVFGKIVGEVDEIIDVGAGEAVDGLPVVADGEKASGGAVPAQRLDEIEEKLGEILVFVDKDELKRGDAGADGLNGGWTDGGLR